jgi:hypothetical protein
MRQRAVVVTVAVHLVLAGTVIAMGVVGTSEWADQTDYHLPVIKQFAEQLPLPELGDYKSATTPGYHLIMATLVRFGIDGVALAFLNALFGATFVGLLTAIVARRASAGVAIAAGCMLGCSPYVLSSSIWLTTDNLASLALLLAAAASLSIADGSARMPIRVGLIASAWATFAVLIRQILIYAAAFPGAAVVARACAQRRMPAPGALFLAGMTLLPAFLVVLAFVALWGGLVPPSFREYHGGGANPVTPVYVLALVAIWGMAAFVTIPGFVRELCTTRMAFLGVLAAMVACIVPSSYIVHVRFGGILWTVASKLPAPFDRSILLVVLAGLGAAALGAYLRLWSRSADIAGRGVGVFALFVLVGMTAAQTANQQCFERYLQPLVVVCCVLAAVGIAGRSMRAWPLVIATIVALGLSAFNVARVGG